METLTYITDKYGLDVRRRSLIEIPNVTREDLAALFADLGFTRGVEIGTERGAYAEVLCRANPSLTLTCVDAWRRLRGYRDHVDGLKMQRFFEEATERLAPYGVEIVRDVSVTAAATFPDGHFDFCYIDANHAYESVVADLAAWAPKVRVGGMISGHDFLTAKWPARMAVPQAVCGWVDAYEIAPLLIFGAKEKVPGVKRDDGRSWAYVQPAPRQRPAKIRQ